MCSSKQTRFRNTSPMTWLFATYLATQLSAATIAAEAIRVPQDHKTIQAGINAASDGAVVLVGAGTYRERIRMKAGVTVRSVGDNAKGKSGLKRAEATIIDGNVEGASGAGATMAEGSTLDGFTVTGVGKYDDDLWNKHYATKGEHQSHEHIGKPGTAGIAVLGISHCTVANNIVHHIGYSGIAIMGAEGKRGSPRIVGNVSYRNMGGGIGSMKGSTATIENNTCFENFYAGIGHDNASPLVIGNVCYGNVRAGIGVSEHAKPVVRGNTCYKNRRAGIGIRTGAETSPVVEHNVCYENDMAGIGSRDDATPIIRHNKCYKNAMAGIGCQTNAKPLIEHNECYENKMAGIGCQTQAQPVIRHNICRNNARAGIGVERGAKALILDNKCVENKLVAIGVRNGSTAHIAENLLVRTGGMPPMIAIRENSTAVVRNNTIRGGGVAGVMVQGTATIDGNQFEGNGPRRGGPPNFAVWVHAGADVTVNNNRADRWRHSLFASAARRVRATGNTTSNFIGKAIVVNKSELPAHVFGNTALSDDAKDVAAEVGEPKGVVADNNRKSPPKEEAAK